MDEQENYLSVAFNNNAITRGNGGHGDSLMAVASSYDADMGLIDSSVQDLSRILAAY